MSLSGHWVTATRLPATGQPACCQIVISVLQRDASRLPGPDWYLMDGRFGVCPDFLFVFRLFFFLFFTPLLSERRFAISLGRRIVKVWRRGALSCSRWSAWVNKELQFVWKTTVRVVWGCYSLLLFVLKPPFNDLSNNPRRFKPVWKTNNLLTREIKPILLLIRWHCSTLNSFFANYSALMTRKILNLNGVGLCKLVKSIPVVIGTCSCICMDLGIPQCKVGSRRAVIDLQRGHSAVQGAVRKL